ncbi:MAG TPA: CUAEP/CCAEP-tail radical SAM protein [Gemmatimonadales bacterium]|nr:CUAEP/CCAEP-tail radical SAM protein [Gemmatimonadales bacterium]
MHDPGRILLVSCYELGHQPLGLAWPRAFLERAGYAPACLDLAVEPLDEEMIARAGLVAVAVPMHTALRIGVAFARRVRVINPACFVCFYGLYATLNADVLLSGLADAVIGGEVEERLVTLARQVESREAVEVRRAPLERLTFPVPARQGLPDLHRYVHFARNGTTVPAGYVEASRGCLHLCLHCPIPPVYGGRFFAVPRDIVLADIRQLVAGGARHITFGDPDFLNGPAHALKLARALHAEFPEVSFDCTTKIEHILEHRALVPELAALGCAFVVSAVESTSDAVLRELAKGHTKADIETALAITREAGITLRPSFVAFTPWTTLEDYVAMLEFVDARDLVLDVDPVQYAIRLLVPPGSGLLTQGAMRAFLGPLDAERFTYRWTHPDPRMDALHQRVTGIVEAAARRQTPAGDTFERIVEAALAARGERSRRWATRGAPRIPPASPRLTEPWFC